MIVAQRPCHSICIVRRDMPLAAMTAVRHPCLDIRIPPFRTDRWSMTADMHLHSADILVQPAMDIFSASSSRKCLLSHLFTLILAVVSTVRLTRKHPVMQQSLANTLPLPFLHVLKEFHVISLNPVRLCNIIHMDSFTMSHMTVIAKR